MASYSYRVDVNRPFVEVVAATKAALASEGFGVLSEIDVASTMKKKLDKDAVPAAEFRAQCRAYAEKWVGIQMAQFQRLGVMGEWDDPYLTMKYEAEAAIALEMLAEPDPTGLTYPYELREAGAPLIWGRAPERCGPAQEILLKPLFEALLAERAAGTPPAEHRRPHDRHGRHERREPVSYTHLTLPTKRIV